MPPAWIAFKNALELARQLGDRETLFSVLARLLSAPLVPEHQILRLHLAEEFVGHSLEGVSIRTQSDFLGGCCNSFGTWGLRSRVDETHAELRALAERTRDPSAIWFARNNQTRLDFIDGQLEQVVASAGTQRYEAAAMGSPILGERNLWTAFRPRLLLGRARRHSRP